MQNYIVLRLTGADAEGNAFFKQVGDLWPAEDQLAAVDQALTMLDPSEADSTFIAFPEESFEPIVRDAEGRATFPSHEYLVDKTPVAKIIRVRFPSHRRSS